MRWPWCASLLGATALRFREPTCEDTGRRLELQAVLGHICHQVCAKGSAYPECEACAPALTNNVLPLDELLAKQLAITESAEKVLSGHAQSMLGMSSRQQQSKGRTKVDVSAMPVASARTYDHDWPSAAGALWLVHVADESVEGNQSLDDDFPELSAQRIHLGLESSTRRSELDITPPVLRAPPVPPMPVRHFQLDGDAGTDPSTESGRMEPVFSLPPALRGGGVSSVREQAGADARSKLAEVTSPAPAILDSEARFESVSEVDADDSASGDAAPAPAASAESQDSDFPEPSIAAHAPAPGLSTKTDSAETQSGAVAHGPRESEARSVPSAVQSRDAAQRISTGASARAPRRAEDEPPRLRAAPAQRQDSESHAGAAAGAEASRADARIEAVPKARASLDRDARETQSGQENQSGQPDHFSQGRRNSDRESLRAMLPSGEAPMPVPWDDSIKDLGRRVELQNRLAELCKRQCLDIGAYPFCTQCPQKVNPVPMPLSWQELFARMEHLKSWGHPQLEISHLSLLGESCEVVEERRSLQLREMLLQACVARGLACTSLQSSQWEGLLKEAQYVLAP